MEDTDVSSVVMLDCLQVAMYFMKNYFPFINLYMTFRVMNHFEGEINKGDIVCEFHVRKGKWVL